MVKETPAKAETPKTAMSVSVAQIVDIRDNMLKYLVLQNGNGKVVINIGDKTYNSVKDLIEGKKEGKK